MLANHYNILLFQQLCWFVVFVVDLSLLLKFYAHNEENILINKNYVILKKNENI